MSEKWIVKSPGLIVDEAGIPVAVGIGRPVAGDWKKDTDLIAAAPEMLEALERIWGIAEEADERTDWKSLECRLLNIQQAAEFIFSKVD